MLRLHKNGIYNIKDKSKGIADAIFHEDVSAPVVELSAVLVGHSVVFKACGSIDSVSYSSSVTLSLGERALYLTFWFYGVCFWLRSSACACAR